MSEETYPRDERCVRAAKVLPIRRARCGRCGGSGIYTPFHGVCWRCGGCGVDPTHMERELRFPPSWTDAQCEAYVAKKAAEAAAKAEARRLERLAVREANLARLGDATPDELASLFGAADDIYGKALDGPWSDRQVECILKDVARQREQAAAGPVPTGKARELLGKVLSLKLVEPRVYGASATLKMTLQGHAGWRLYVSVPRDLDPQVGDVVELVCNVEASSDDPSFGFGKLPRKAAIISRA